MPSGYYKIVENTLGRVKAKRLWTASYNPAIPATINMFPIGGLLPAIMYLARWGHRPGRGTFYEIYGSDGSKSVTAEHMASILRESGEIAVSGPAGSALLADLLVAHCFDTKNRESRRDTPIIRAYPVHYLSSWLDIDSFGHFRGIPELVTAIMANQPSGQFVGPNDSKTRFAVGKGITDNLLLDLLGPGMAMQGHSSSMTTADVFREDQAGDLSIEQLLMVRAGLLVGEAPGKVRGQNPAIPNQQPLTETQTRIFRDDLRVFLEAYGRVLPWQAFIAMLEVALGIGLTTIVLASAQMLFAWEDTGTLPSVDEPWPIFVDASMGTDKAVQWAAEESLDRAYRAMEHLPLVLSMLRVLDSATASHRRFQDRVPEPWPVGAARINLLGDVREERVADAERVLDAIHEDCVVLAEALKAEDVAGDVYELLLRNEIPPPIRLGEAIVRLMGPVSQQQHYQKFLTSCLVGDDLNPAALLHRRKAQRNNRKYEARSLVLNNVALDYLVHRHLWKNGSHRKAALSLSDFTDVLRENYGIYVDQEPPGMTIAAETLLKNRFALERRLRDMGLLVGVNDAEAMKYLRPRFGAVTEKGIEYNANTL